MICSECGAETGGEVAKHETPKECVTAWRAIAGYAMVASMTAKRKIQRCRAMGHPGRKAFSIEVKPEAGEKRSIELCFRCAVDGFVGHYVAAEVFEVFKSRGVKFEDPN